MRRLRLLVLSDFGTQFLIGFLRLRGAPRDSQLQNVVETPQLHFLCLLVADVQCNPEKFVAVPFSKSRTVSRAVKDRPVDQD